MKVIVTTIVALNPGDAAILQGTRDILGKTFGPGTEITAIDRHPDVAQKLYPWMPFSTAIFGGHARGRLGRWIQRLGYEHRLRRVDPYLVRVAARLMQWRLGLLARLLISRKALDTICEYLDSDLVIASGGTYLVPAYSVEAPIQDYEFALWLGRPLVFMPQSMGPFADMPQRARLLDVLCRSKSVMVRDAQSRQHLIDIGVPFAQVSVVPDAAFALASTKARSRGENRGARLRIAVSVREWTHFARKSVDDGMDDYFTAIADLVKWLVEARGAQITLVSSCQGIPDYWTNDAATADKVVCRLDPKTAEQVIVDRDFRQPAALLELLEEFDLVVATRMHMAILALCVGTPVLPIAYEFKTSQLFNGLGLGDFVTSIEEIEGVILIERAASALDHAAMVREKMQKGIRVIENDLQAIQGLLLGAMATGVTTNSLEE